MVETSAVQVLQNARQAAGLLHPLRLRMLDALAEPDSASGLAKRLKLPRQKVNYHLRALERLGLVRLVEERRRRNCTERVVRAVARSYVISPAALGRMGADTEWVQDKFSSAYLVAVAARAIRELAELREGAEAAGKKLATLTIETELRFATAEALIGFAEELSGAVADLTTKYNDAHAPESRRFRFFLGGHPALECKQKTGRDSDARSDPGDGNETDSGQEGSEP